MKIAIAQLNSTIGDIAGNLAKIEKALSSCAGNNPDLLILPELFLTGYPPTDLLEQPAFIEKLQSGISHLCALSKRFAQTGILCGTVLPTGKKTGRGLYNEAMNEYQLALELDPNAPGVAEGMREVEAERQRGRVSLEAAKARAREKALPGLDLGPEAQQPLGLVFRNATLREAYLALGRAAGVNITFDPSFQDTTVSLDLKDVGFEQALNALAAAGRTFHRVVDAKVLNVVPDTPTKRREFEQQVVKTYVSRGRFRFVRQVLPSGQRFSITLPSASWR